MKLRSQVGRMSTEQGRWEKDIRAAAKRQAWDDVTFNVRDYVKPLIARELSTILYELSALPEKPSSTDLHFVRSAAASLKDWLAGLDIEPEGSYVAELKRLRDALTEQGQKLHAEYGQSTGERCGCPGCELIRAAYAEPAAGDPS